MRSATGSAGRSSGRGRADPAVGEASAAEAVSTSRDVDVGKEIEFFDRFVVEHGDSDVLGERAYTRLTDLFARLIAPRPGERCVDLACGTGALTRKLRQFRMRLTGVDISALSLSRAQAHRDAETYVLADIRRTPFPDESMDIVVYSGVLHHCSTRDARIDMLREGHRILRRAGRLFAFDPSAHSPAMLLYRHPRSPLHSTATKTPNEVLLSRGQLTEELAAAGFSGIHVRGVSGMSFRYVGEQLGRLLLPAYNLLYEELIRISPLEDRLGTFLVTHASKSL